MIDVILSVILIVIIIPAICYIVKAKIKGQRCIGCPNSTKCGGKCNCIK